MLNYTNSANWCVRVLIAGVMHRYYVPTAQGALTLHKNYVKLGFASKVYAYKAQIAHTVPKPRYNTVK